MKGVNSMKDKWRAFWLLLLGVAHCGYWIAFQHHAQMPSWVTIGSSIGLGALYIILIQTNTLHPLLTGVPLMGFTAQAIVYGWTGEWNFIPFILPLYTMVLLALGWALLTVSRPTYGDIREETTLSRVQEQMLHTAQFIFFTTLGLIGGVLALPFA